jgi:hypothetical protein
MIKLVSLVVLGFSLPLLAISPNRCGGGKVTLNHRKGICQWLK